MNATLDMSTLFDQTDGIVDMLRHSELFDRYRETKAQLLNDQEAIKLIKSFVKLKERYDEVQRFGKYHPDYHQVIQEMMDMKRDVDLNDKIADFKKAESDFEGLLNEISLLIASSVSPSIKVPNGDPFFDRGCSGGCATGGPCGCH